MRGGKISSEEIKSTLTFRYGVPVNVSVVDTEDQQTNPNEFQE